MKRWRLSCVALAVLLALGGVQARGAVTEGAWREDYQWAGDRNVQIEWKGDWAGTYTFNRDKWKRELSGKERDAHLQMRLIGLLEAEMGRWPEQTEKVAGAYQEIGDHLRNLGYLRAAGEYGKKSVEKWIGNTDQAASVLSWMLRGADGWPVEPIEWAARRLIALHRIGAIGDADWRLPGAYEALAEVERRQGHYMEAQAAIREYEKVFGTMDWVKREEAQLFADAGHVEEAIELGQAALAEKEDGWFAGQVSRWGEGQVLSVGRFAGNETTTLKWNILRIRPGEDLGKDLLELSLEDSEGAVVVPWGEGLYVSLREGVDRMIRGAGEDVLRKVREGEEGRMKGLGGLAGYRKAPWAEGMQEKMLEMGESQMREGHFGLARRDFEDVMGHSGREEMRERARRGLQVLEGQHGRGAHATEQVAHATGEVWPEELISRIPAEISGVLDELSLGSGGTVVGGPKEIACYEGGKVVWTRRGRLREGTQGLMQKVDWPYVTLPGEFAPVVEGKRVYTRWGLDGSGQYMTGVACFDLKSGEMIWTTDGGEAGDVWPVGDPAVAEGRIYYLGMGEQGSAEGSPVFLVCLDQVDGKVVFRRRLADLSVALTLHGDRERDRDRPLAVDLAHYGNAVTVADGAVYVSSNMGVVARFDARDGAIEWARTYPRARMTDESWPIFRRKGTSPVVVGGKVVFAPRDYYGAFAVDAKSGAMVWERPLVVSSEVAEVNGDVVVMRDEGRMVGVKVGDGMVEWEREIADEHRTSNTQHPTLNKERGGWWVEAGNPRMLVPPDGAKLEGKVFVESEGSVEAVVVGSGKVIWRREIGQSIVKIEWGEGVMLVVGPNGVECIEGETGKKRWNTAAGFLVQDSAVAGKVIVVADEDRRRGVNFAGIDIATGQMIWERGPGSGSERIGDVDRLISDGTNVHVIARWGGYGDFVDVAFRAADGAMLGARNLLRERGGPKFVVFEGKNACAVGEKKTVYWFTLNPAAPSGLVARSDALRAYSGEARGLMASGPWACVRVEHPRLGMVTVVLNRDDPAYLLEREHPGVIRGGKFYEMDGRTIAVVDLKSRREERRFVIPVVEDMDHRTEVVEFWEEGGEFRVLSGMEKGLELKQRRPGEMRVDVFDAATGEHRSGWVLEGAPYWKAWTIHKERDEDRPTAKVWRKTQAVQVGKTLVVSSADGVYGFESAAVKARERRICYREGAKPAEGWEVKGRGTVGISHDWENLYVSAVYRDDLVRPMMGHGEQMGGDYIEIALTTNMGVFRLGAGVDEHGKGVVENFSATPLPGGSTVEVGHDLGRMEHRYRVGIPLKGLVYRGVDQAWRKMGISITVWEDGVRQVMQFGEGMEGKQVWAGGQELIYLDELTQEEEQAGLEIVDRLADWDVAKAFFEGQCEARRESPGEASTFVQTYLKKHPDGALALWAMEWLDGVLRGEDGASPAEAVTRLARGAGVGQEPIQQYATVAGAYLSQWVYVDANRPPRMLMIQLNDGQGWEHRISWGEYQAMAAGVWGTASRRVVGKMPGGGKWVELRVPLIWVGMQDRPICGISFGQVGGGKVYWDHSAVVVDGKETVFVEDQTPSGKAGGFWDWTGEQKKSGEKAHTYVPPVGEDEAAWHDVSELKEPITAHLVKMQSVQVKPDEVVGVLEKDLPRLGDSDASIAFFRGMVELEGKDPGRLLERYKWFFKVLPNHPRGAEVLNDLRLALGEKAVEGVIEQAKVPLKTRYAYRRSYVYPQRAYITQWQVIGGFANLGDRGLETAFAPETDRFRPEAEYAGATEALKWKKVESGGDYVDLMGVCAPNDHAVAYAVSWVWTEKARTAAIELGSDDGSKVWINRKLVHSAHRHDYAERGEWRVPIFLTAGWNEVMVKVEQDTGDWGFFFELADPEGRGKLGDVKMSGMPGGR